MSPTIRPVVAAAAAALILATLSAATFATQQPPPSSIPQEWGAQGGPIHRKCSEIGAAITQMESGMVTQDGWLRSAEAQLRAAEAGALESEKDRRDFFFKQLQDFALGQLQAVATLKNKVKALDSVNLTREQKRRVLGLEKKAERINKLADELLKKQREADSRYDYDKKLRENKAELMDLLTLAGDTGVADHLVSTLAMAGPFGKLAAEGGKLVIDASLLAFGSVISEEELRRSRADLNLLRETHTRNRGIISDLEQERAAAAAAGQCPSANAAPQNQQPSSLTPPLPEPASPAPPTPPTEKKGSNFVAQMLGLTAATAGVVVAAVAYEDYRAQKALEDAGSSGNDSGSSGNNSSSISMTYVGNSTNGFQCNVNFGGIVNNCTATITVNVRGSIPQGTNLRLQAQGYNIGGNRTTAANPPGNMTFSLSGGPGTSSCPAPVTRLNLIRVSDNTIIAQVSGLSLRMTCQ